ncbi:hypothetical protein ACLB2K_023506 [Fragaria x ananassa]
MDAPLKDLKEKLLCDDGVSMLVLTAPGGCGKTTLATMFCKDEEVKGKFKNNIVFITVSQNGNLELVVKRLFKLLDDNNAMKLFYHLTSTLSYSRRSLEKDGKALQRIPTCYYSCGEITCWATYRDLGSFPEDKKIPVGDLIDMWAELYDLDDDIVFAYVHELCNRNLATLVDERYLKIEGDDYYGGRFVTQHDLLSELAIYNAKLNPLEQRKRMIVEIGGDNIPKWWKEQKYQPTKARLLSIRTDEEFSMKWPQFQLPEAEVLVLDLDGYMYALPEFVEKMHKLKVAVIVARSHICSKGVGKMSDAFPNLEELNIDNCKEPEELLADFCNVIYLKKISIFDCDDLLRLPKEIGNLVNLEVLRPRECTEVLKFTGSVRNKLPEDIGELRSLRKLDLRQCFRVRKLPPSVLDLDQLEEVICEKKRALLWEAFLHTHKPTRSGDSLRVVFIGETMTYGLVAPLVMRRDERGWERERRRTLQVLMVTPKRNFEPLITGLTPRYVEAVISLLQCANRAITEPVQWVASRRLNSGLKKKEMVALPTSTYSNSSSSCPSPSSSPGCAICLVDFSDGDKIRVLPKCNHRFHVVCIDKWLQSHSSCPTCRHRLKSSSDAMLSLSEILTT